MFLCIAWKVWLGTHLALLGLEDVLVAGTDAVGRGVTHHLRVEPLKETTGGLLALYKRETTAGKMQIPRV